jgi:hypothetical protein
MKNKFQISEASSTAALEDAKNFGLLATLEKEDENLFIAYESKAYCDAPCDKPTNPTWDDYYALSKDLYSEMQYQLKWLREDINYYSQAWREHQVGHLPKILDAGKMQAAINTLGIGDSYTVRKAEVVISY